MPLMTNVTVVDEGTVARVAAELCGEGLWISAPELVRGTGWERKPAGICRGAVCVPIPPLRESEFVRPDGSVNVAALARHRGQAVVHDDTATVWVFGNSDEVRGAMLGSAAAPDFTLPDVRGHLHSLSEARGKKVLLAAWASW